MEGLIPMVYKALKKKTTRRQYKCLSSGAAQTYNNNISVDFYAQQGYKSYQLEMASSIGGGGGDVELMASSNGRHHHHRRHKSSIGDYSTGFSAAPEDTDTDTVVLHNKQPQPKPKLVRFRSHRFFSCVTPNSA
ncbi:uncharacterized protein LOC114302051 [Camellia sinensis]|uniref:uncharacterized protein LOC114302051 n=1 Tax=Camellia sinensis TaxID=4442 RepID=UPI0010364B57|nr:uncharacterized protein LOC114302051 [Camellia sinensis]